MTRGRWFAALRRRHVDARSGVDPDAIMPALSRLGTALDGLHWMLVSGLAISLHVGRLYRCHRDIDIAVPEHELADVVIAMRAAGFQLARRIFMTRIGESQVELWARLDDAMRLPLPCVRHLRFWPADRPRAGQGRTLPARRGEPYVDVFPYRVRDGVLTILGGGREVPVQEPLWAPVTLADGTVIPVETLPHLQHVKQYGNRPVDALDRAVLYALVPH